MCQPRQFGILAVPGRLYRSALEVVDRGFPEPSRQTLCGSIGVERIAPPKPLGPFYAARRRPLPSTVGPDGFARLAGAGARPGCGPRVDALSVHRQLVEAGFLLGTDDGGDQ